MVVTFWGSCCWRCFLRFEEITRNKVALHAMAENGWLRVKHGKILSDNGARLTWVHEKGVLILCKNIKSIRAQKELVEIVEHFMFFMRWDLELQHRPVTAEPPWLCSRTTLPDIQHTHSSSFPDSYCLQPSPSFQSLQSWLSLLRRELGVQCTSGRSWVEKLMETLVMCSKQWYPIK